MPDEPYTSGADLTPRPTISEAQRTGYGIDTNRPIFTRRSDGVPIREYRCPLCATAYWIADDADLVYLLCLHCLGTRPTTTN